MTGVDFTSPTAERKKFAADPHRPGYHYLPPRNWINDPNGLIQWGGRYHLFYQYNPYGPLWGSIHWGHASSTDLIYWEDHPVALKPEQDTGDENGCWSGCIVNDQGVPTALYTGFVDESNTPVMLARALGPDLIRWHKFHKNPVIAKAPSGVKNTDFRDPYVWREGDLWKMVMGAGLENGNCAILLYESHDLISWDYLGILFDMKVSEEITTWECPSFFPLGNHYVLLISLCPGFSGVYYYAGDYDGIKFDPLSEGFLESGSIFYAPHLRQVEDGRMIMFAWLREGRTEAAIEKAGWAGVQSLPAVLTLDEELQLVSEPVEEISVLRGEKFQLSDVSLSADQTYKIPLRGSQLEIEVEFDLIQGPVGLCVRTTDDEAEMTCIGFDPHKGVAFLDTARSSLDQAVVNGWHEESLSIDTHEPLRIHAFIDGSVIEVWFNDHVRISGRVYPTREDANGVKLFAHGEPAHVKSMNIWEMKEIWD
jgi:beta-fructofuranosidase